MDWYIYPLVIAAGFACGFINTLAGSGSLITLPLLIFLGLPANVANGTNRVAILLQTAVGTWSFHQQGVLHLKRGLILALPAIVGAVLGAQVAVNLDERMLRHAIGVLMLVMFVILLVRPKRWLQGHQGLTDKPVSVVQLLVFFAIGFYGGFIQAGVGLFLLAGLVLGAGFDLVKANAVKVLINLVFTVFALGVFLLNDQVDWFVGLILAAGNMLGAWVAARMAVQRGAAFVRWLLIAVVLLSAAVLLGVPELIKRLL
ncbi:MAG: sulfite exporter TauE/SafE family protein [candidate division Zixibacteria bacterium]|nr:sulfite exporter TauE/SafE family protein [candidate division Zixibacteria bacterium]